VGAPTVEPQDREERVFVAPEAGLLCISSRVLAGGLEASRSGRSKGSRSACPGGLRPKTNGPWERPTLSQEGVPPPVRERSRAIRGTPVDGSGNGVIPLGGGFPSGLPCVQIPEPRRSPLILKGQGNDFARRATTAKGVIVRGKSESTGSRRGGGGRGDRVAGSQPGAKPRTQSEPPADRRVIPTTASRKGFPSGLKGRDRGTLPGV